MPGNIHFFLFFEIPGSHTEKPSFGRLEPGVSVYSRRVLIKPKAREILPDWLRFVKGVVDSENQGKSDFETLRQECHRVKFLDEIEKHLNKLTTKMKNI